MNKEAFNKLMGYPMETIEQLVKQAKEINRKPFIGQALADKRNKPPYHQPHKCDELAERAKDGDQEKM